MPLLNRRMVMLAGLGLGAGVAWGRQAPDRPENIFDKVVSHPTGRNGYEELVAAADAARESRLFAEAQQMPGCSLAVRRQVQADPPVVRALALLDRGLAKPITSPRDPEAMNAGTLFPEFAGFRNLARLIGFEQYVLFADGRAGDAIAGMRKCALLGRAIQLDTLIAGLVGLAIFAIGTTAVGAHLGQLEARDCELLFQVCIEQLAQPDLFPSILEGERRFAKNTMRSALEGEGRRTIVDDFGDGDAESRALTRELGQQAATADGRTTLLRDFSRRIDAFYDQAIAEAAKPAWERAAVEPAADASLAGRLVALLAPVIGGAGNAYTRNTARMRLLAGHAAIRRYLWEHDRLPQSLAELQLRDLAVDPFTAEPLQYQVSGRSYRLISAGQVAEADDENAVNGRRPVTVVPGE